MRIGTEANSTPILSCSVIAAARSALLMLFIAAFPALTQTQAKNN